MTHAKNKVEWCLRKAEKELKKTEKHKGLIKIKPDLNKARDFIAKAEHYLKATEYLKKDFSDISASTVFYSMYSRLLAIITKLGYESGNQECTFALVLNSIEEGKISFSKELLEKISSLDEEKSEVKEKVKTLEKNISMEQIYL